MKFRERRMKQYVWPCMLIVFISSIYTINAQNDTSHSVYPEIRAYRVKNKEHIDSSTYVDLVISSTWLNLPDHYQLKRCDTLIGVRKFNALLLKSGKMIAVGNTKKKNMLSGRWYIKAKNPYPDGRYYFCWWGKLKKGVKKGTWWTFDGFFIRFYTNGTKWAGHNQWVY